MKYGLQGLVVGTVPSAGASVPALNEEFHSIATKK